MIEGRDHESGSHFIRTAGEDIELIGASVADQDFIASARQDVVRLVRAVRMLKRSTSRPRRLANRQRELNRMVDDELYDASALE